ncbi:hypothetical protein ASF00_07505 [Sphingomonas sp. Leaf34]|nr:hypothetical protein ASF00_07505 [Sphingomonas sp. Leaf34]
MIGAEHLTPDDLTHLESIFNQGMVNVDGMTAFAINNAIVFPSGVVALQDGRVITESVLHSRPGSKQRLDEFLDAAEASRIALATEDIVHIPAALLLNQWSADNYGHFVAEVLPKLPFAASVTDVRGIQALIGRRVRGHIRDIYAEAIATTRLALPLVFHERPRRVDWLVFITTAGSHGGSKYPPNLLQTRDLITASGALFQPKRIWLYRSSKYKRRLIDQEKLAHHLENSGFVILDVQGMSLSQQAAAVSDARIIVGPVGAAFANIIFAPSHAQVITLCPGGGRETFFYDCATICGQQYTYVFGESLQPELRYNSDFRIDPAHLDLAVVQAENRLATRLGTST